MKGARETDARRQGGVDFVAVGRVVRPHGVRGALLISSISELVNDLQPGTKAFLGPKRLPFDVEYLQPHRGKFLLMLGGLGNRDRAEAMRDLEICVRVEDSAGLPDGTYYHWQIIGLKAVSSDGEALGSVVRILETGANDVYVIEDETGGEKLIPAIDSVIKQVDLEAGRIVVTLLPGL